MINSLCLFENSKESIHMFQILLEIIIILNIEELAYLNCLSYPEDYPYSETNINSIKCLLTNLLVS